MNEKQIVTNAFNIAFNIDVTPMVFFAPGRVNLIGEHTDYNGGHVFPCALTIGTYGAVLPREDNKVRFFSVNFESEGIIERTIDDNNLHKNYSDYPIGVIYELKSSGYNISHGFDMAIYGNIPTSSGLSSSASIEVLTATIARELYNLDIDGIEIAKLTQKAENEFVGVNCGIMDQFVIANAKENSAIFLDTNTLKFEYIPIKLSGYKIVIVNTNKKRGLLDSKYNERRAECESVVKMIPGIKALGELTNEQFQSIKIDDEVLKKRARHAVSENIRTIDAANALIDNNIELFGKLMIESHISLRDDYEVTGIELDTLFDEACKQPYVIGTRMTGAGFGGCTVTIIKDEYIDNFIENVGKAYKAKTNLNADFYVVEIGGGPKKI